MPSSAAVPHVMGSWGSKDGGDLKLRCPWILARRRAKVFEKAGRAKLSVNMLPKLAALLVNWIICFQKEKEVEENSVEGSHYTGLVVVN